MITFTTFANSKGVRWKNKNKYTNYVLKGVIHMITGVKERNKEEERNKRIYKWVRSRWLLIE